MKKHTNIDIPGTSLVHTFDISYSSVYDGPGTRVVVFFQGCNANCCWCHSPHSQPRFSPLLFNEMHCVYCGRCQVACVHNVHLVKNGQHYINRNNCIRCGKCVEACPNSFSFRQAGALHLATIVCSVQELFQQLLPHLNLVKYDGGITLSGGEALLQKEAARELLKLCKQNGFSTAVETSGLLPVEYYQNLDRLVDCWLFGMRFTTNYPQIKHLKAITESFKTISAYNSQILPRIPVVPGHTDSDWYLQKCSEFLQKNQVDYVFINPWNSNVSHYYRLSGLDEPMSMFSAETVADSERKITVHFQERNIEVKQINSL